MMLVIFLLALVMIVAGGASLVAGLALTPTDLGFAYVQSGTIALSAGMVMLAIGLAARVLDTALRRLATPAALRAEIQREPVLDRGMQDPGTPGAGVSSSPPAGLAAGAIVATGAAIAAGAAMATGKEGENTDFSAGSEPVDPAAISLDQLEMDLLGVAQKGSEPEMAVEPGAIAAAAEPVEAEAAPVAMVPMPEPAPEIAPESDVVPGLIADPDFEAVLENQKPALAPLDTLEVIGAYDSGGTRFTMYSDGSVVAAGPDGEQRFRSLEELRAFIDARA